MSSPYSTARVDSNNGHSSPIFGGVYWSPTRSLWNTFIYAGAIFGGYATFRWDALLLFVVTSFITLCAGYSVGIHRRLIHKSFGCHQWLENSLVYLGVLIGAGGPFSLVGAHDLRDWAQRQPHCHDYFTSRRNILTDWAWQTHCDIQLHYPPALRYEPGLAQNEFYQWLEQTWMLQQLPWAVAFYCFGGWRWFFWGIYVRIAVSVTGIWLAGYLAQHKSEQIKIARTAEHPTDPRSSRRVKMDLEQVHSFQCRNIPWLSILTAGESWQSNHQTFPNSAKFSLRPGQHDPGWWFIKVLQYIGLAWNIQKPKPQCLNKVVIPFAVERSRPKVAAQTPVEPRRKITTT